MDAPNESDELAPLVRALRDGNQTERAAALRDLPALGARAEPAIPVLLKLLRHRNLALRRQTGETLARLGRPGVRALLNGLSDDDADFRKAIVVVLGWIGPDAAEAVPALEALAEDDWLGPSAVEALLRILGDPRATPVRTSSLGGIVIAVGVAFLVLGGLALGIWYWIAHATLPPAALPAALGVGGVAGCMAPLVGYRSWSPRRMAAMTVLFALGGVLAGLLLGIIVGSLIEPIMRILGRRA